MKKNKLQSLLNKLNGTDETTLEGFKMFDEGVKKLKDQLTENIKISTLDNVNSELKKFKAKLDFQPLLESIDTLKENFKEEVESLSIQLERKVKELVTISKNNGIDALNKIQPLSDEIDTLKKNIGAIVQEKNKDVSDLNKLVGDSKTKENLLASKIKELNEKIDETNGEISETEDELEKEIEDLKTSLQKTRNELSAQIANKGGGSMNRNIAIGGNSSVLSRYTDLNIKPGTNVTLSYANNNNTKAVDLTITASGGAGTSRYIASTAVSSVIGAIANTDYVVIATEGVKVTLPTAVSNENLYTIKNVAASSVLVATTGAETIDTSANLILATQFTAVDLISDGANWNIT